MNKELLQKILTKDLVGEKIYNGYYAYWRIEADILGVVRNILTCEGVRESIISQVSVRRSKYDLSYYILKYKDHFITNIAVHKQKGKWIGSYTAQQYEWYYKSFDLTEETDFDFNDRVVEIENEIIAEAKRKEEQDDELFEIYKQLKAICGERYIGTIISRLYREEYSLSVRYKNEAEQEQKIIVLPKVLDDFAGRLGDLNEQINTLLDEATDKRCEWENADDLDAYEETYEELKSKDIEYEDVVKELNYVEDILTKIAETSKKLEMGEK